jgi:parallel beta-helix repeat protein
MSANAVIRTGVLSLLSLSLAGSRPSFGAQEQVTKDGKTFYVATNGNDAWSGTLPEPNAAGTDGPLQSLVAARDLVRKLGGPDAQTAPVTVLLRGGTYLLSKPVVFEPRDSGTKQSPRIYQAYGKETPVISAGREIHGWRRVGAASDLPANGLGAPPFQENLWMAEVPGASEGYWNFHQLFVNGQRRIRARAPNGKFFNVDGRVSTEGPSWFRFHPGDIDPAWIVGGTTEMVGLTNWAGFRLFVKQVNPTTNTAILAAKRQAWGSVDNPRYWLENFPQALDSPGEWYLDRINGVVYYHAMADEDMSKAEVIAPTIEQLIRLEGDAEGENELLRTRYISFEGLTFSYTDWDYSTRGWVHSYVQWSKPEDGRVDEQSVPDVSAAIEGVGSHAVSISKCTFTHLGGYAVDFHAGSKENVVSRNSMSDLGAGGVKIGDSRAPTFDWMATTDNVVSDNSIHDIGNVYLTGTGIWVGLASANTIAHNEVFNTYYIGVSVGWTWGYGPSWAHHNIIEFNNIHDIGRAMLSDMACIYAEGVQPGTMVRNNLCHEVTHNDHGYGAWGIYLDEGSGNIVVENNVTYNTEDGGFMQNYGRENIIRNNIFALGRNGAFQRNHNEPHITMTAERNIFYGKTGKLLVGGYEDGHFKLDHNLYFLESGEPKFADKSFADWKKTGQDVHSLIGSPQFADPEHGDFSMKPESPAFKIGFKPIDLTAVGPRKSE